MPDGSSHNADERTSAPGREMRSGVTTLKWHPARSGSKLGRYRLGARLGLGGAASVYLARQDGPHDFERVLAIKIIHEHLTEEPEFVTMFLDEANLAVRLQHPNIVHVYELGHEGETMFMAMEYLNGQTLSTVMRTINERGKRLPFDVIAWIGAQAAEGLRHAHELCDDSGQRVGLVHRDISPDNIFVTYDGHIKLIDFGIAQAAGRTTTTELGKIKGKYSYMAPEQALGREIDHRADLFSLGTTLYEAALCAPLFAGIDDADTLANLLSGPVPDPRARIPGFPQELAPVLLRALEIEPETRYASAGTMARELETFAAEQGGGQRERLAELMAEMFAEDRALKARAISELKQIHTMVPPALEPPASSGRQWILLAAASAVVLMGAVGIVVALGGEEAAPQPSAAPPVAPVPNQVTVSVQTQPAAESKIEIDGRTIVERPARADFARAETPISVVVTAKGYETARLEIVPDRDHSLVVPLIRQETKPAASASASAAAEPQKPAPGRPSRPSGPSQPQQPGKPGLATDYPF